MKTNVIMTRPMGQFEVLQRTNDAMFNASALLSQWNKASGQQKQMTHYTSNNSTKELIEAIENEYELKQRNYVLIQSRGKNGGTWMHPLLFIDFAMWINPKFKVKVLRFVYDELIKNRHLAGDSYRSLSASASIFPNVNYTQIAKGLNWITFNKHYKDIRNNATYEQLEQLHKVEEQLCFAIDMGLIRDYPSLITTMRKMYNDKYQKF